MKGERVTIDTQGVPASSAGHGRYRLRTERKDNPTMFSLFKILCKTVYEMPEDWI
jgi:hypothetical protein